MKKLLFVLFMPLLLAACEQTKEAGDETARELTGSNMIEQGNAMKAKIKGIEAQQQQRYEQVDSQ